MEAEEQGREQRLLLASACATLALSLAGFAVGVLSGAKSIVFDGVYSLADAGLTLAALLAARLIARGADSRFQFGYWHIEPMLKFLNGSVLLVACAYALVDGAAALRMGGREVTFGPGLAYGAASAVACLGFHLVMRTGNRAVGSSLLALDARAWLFSGTLNAGICVAFGLACALEDGRASRLVPYLDPAILILLAAGMAPLPLRTLAAAGREILQMAPADLDERVKAVAGRVAADHGFVEHRSSVTRVGRAQFVEIGFVGRSGSEPTSLGQLDAVRAEIAEALRGCRPNQWLTIHFTADRRWL